MNSPFHSNIIWKNFILIDYPFIWACGWRFASQENDPKACYLMFLVSKFSELEDYVFTQSFIIRMQHARIMGFQNTM